MPVRRSRPLAFLAVLLALVLRADLARALVCGSPKTLLTAQEQLDGVIRGEGSPFDYSVNGLIDAGDAVTLLRGVAGEALPDCATTAQDFRYLADGCLNVALGEGLPGVQLADKLARAGDDVNMIVLHNRSSDPLEYPDGFAVAPNASKGIDATWTPTTAQVGDYEFLVVGDNQSPSAQDAINLIYLKVVNDPAPAAFPDATRPFLLGQSLSPGAWNGLSFPTTPETVFPSGAAVTSQVIGAADVVLLQIFPEWGLRDDQYAYGYQRLTEQIAPTVASIRNAGSDVAIALDIFGTALRSEVGGDIPDDLKAACNNTIRFSCAELRKRLGDYAEAVARALRPPFFVLGVEVDLYRFSRDLLPNVLFGCNPPPQPEYANFATAYRAAYDRVKAVSPSTKTFTSLQYESILAFGTLCGGPANAEERIKQDVAAVLTPLDGKNDLIGITTFPEILRKFELRQDDYRTALAPLDTPIASFTDPADIPADYYRFVTDVKGTAGYPPGVAVVESGWSAQDPDTYTCEELAFYPVKFDPDVKNNRDGISDPALTFRDEAGQTAFLHRMMELMYATVRPDLYVWFYGHDPTAPGTAVVYPIFQTMGLRGETFAFDGACDAANPQSPENRAKAAATGDVSKAAYCDWLRLRGLPYVP